MLIDKIVEQGEAFIKREREIETAEYEAIYNDATFQDLEATGFAISNFEVKKVKTAFFQKVLVSFSKINEQLFNPKLRIKTSDNVLIAEKSKNKDKSPVSVLFAGVVHKVNLKCIQILLDKNEKIRVDTKFSVSTLILKSSDNVTFDRFLKKNKNDVF